MTYNKITQLVFGINSNQMEHINNVHEEHDVMDNMRAHVWNCIRPIQINIKRSILKILKNNYDWKKL